MTIWIHSTVNRNCLQASKPLHSLHNLRVQNSHRLAPVFAVLSVRGFIDDGRLQDFDRVPDAGRDDAAVTAGGRVQDNACRFMEATANCHILLLFNAISGSLFLVKHRTRLPD